MPSILFKLFIDIKENLSHRGGRLMLPSGMNCHSVCLLLLYKTVVMWAISVILFLFLRSYLCYKIGKFTLLMPNVHPNRPELYLCTPVKVNPDKNYFITSFEPNATMQTAHHMIIYGCTTPGSDKAVWDCGEMASEDNTAEAASPCQSGYQIIYAWAKDAPRLQLPNGVGFKVGKDSEIKYLVLQVHYANVDHFKGGKTDNTGVHLEYTERPLDKLAGVLLLGTKGYIAPGKKVEHMESSCTIKENKVIHPFAFRTHTHSLGLVVSGYKVTVDEQGSDTWTLLGRRNPQLPQMFYPVVNSDPIKEGDIVAARCTMKSRKDRYTFTGPTNNDEMCNFYLMYYVDKGEPLNLKYCFSDGPPYYYWFMSEELNNIPDEEATRL